MISVNENHEILFDTDTTGINLKNPRTGKYVQKS